MNHYLLLSIAFVFTFQSCKQECRVVQSAYNNGKEQVVFIYPDCKDTTYFKRHYYYENGQLSSEGFYRNGEKEGKFKSWAENGNQTADWEVLNGKEHGFIQCWYDNGQKKRECICDRGIENGPLKEWHENGMLATSGMVRNNKWEGTWYLGDENGSWKIRTYKNDTLQGYTHEHLIDSGEVILVDGQYEAGKETGLWKWFDVDSVLYTTRIYKDGQLTGERIDYYEDGKIKCKGNLLDGEYDGTVYYYNEQGLLEKTQTYKTGKLLREKSR